MTWAKTNIIDKKITCWFPIIEVVLINSKILFRFWRDSLILEFWFCEMSKVYFPVHFKREHEDFVFSFKCELSSQWGSPFSPPLLHFDHDSPLFVLTTVPILGYLIITPPKKWPRNINGTQGGPTAVLPDVERFVRFISRHKFLLCRTRIAPN